MFENYEWKQSEKISLTQEERKLFSQALQELIFQVDECVKRGKITKKGKISSKGTTSKDIKKHLSFLKEYEIDYQVGIGTTGGFLDDDSCIIFAPSKILDEKLVNGKTLKPTKGVYTYFSYFGYLQGEKGYRLYFGFPDNGDPNKSQCVAVRKMQEDDALQTYKFAYTNLDFEKIINDFEAMMNYFMQFSSIEFTPENLLDKDNQKMNQANNNNALNQILYGSPGTGKTYSTIDRALEILGVNTKDMSREERKKIFEDYKQKGQIEFVTFHQSYGYEEFVEGIKPIPNEQNDSVSYEVKDGIFKTFCNRARKNLEDSQKTKDALQKEANVSNAISDFFNKLISDEVSLSKTQKGEFILREIRDEKVYIQTEDTDSSLKFSIKDFEKIVLSNQDFKSSRELAWEVFGEKNQSQIRTYMFQLYKEFRKGDFNQIQQEVVEEVKQKRYILIIDEINRGNISKIFGELITLIEPSKRIGAKEELRVALPYSANSGNGEKELFGVPNNLYIIGTMNTADRSITSLDTALRRRFEFVEMMPKPSELSKIKVSQDGKEINLSKMLEFINKRIEFLYDREKTIGHAFFLQDEGQTSLDITELKSIFQNKIIPLLQEYFYNDYAQIQAVLNCNGMIEKSEEKIQDLFAMDKLGNELDLEDKAIYTIADKEDELWLNPQTYIDIYKKN